MSAPGAVVFAYHNVGARGLRVLAAHGIDVRLVVTHADDPAETLWFERVSDVAGDLALPWIAPDDANAADVVARVAALAPDFLFSFYYRRMLGAPMLATVSGVFDVLCWPTPHLLFSRLEKLRISARI